MIGQVVIVRLAEQYTLGAITAEYTADEVDVRSFALFADGHIGVVDLPHLQRGTGVDQWQETPPWPAPAAPPQLVEVRAELMPAAQLPTRPAFMVIVRHG